MFSKLTWLAHLLEHPAWRIPRIAAQNPRNPVPPLVPPVEVNLGRLIRRGVRTISRQRGEDPIDQTAKLFQLLLKPVMGNALWHRNHTWWRLIKVMQVTLLVWDVRKVLSSWYTTTLLLHSEHHDTWHLFYSPFPWCLHWDWPALYGDPACSGMPLPQMATSSLQVSILLNASNPCV